MGNFSYITICFIICRILSHRSFIMTSLGRKQVPIFPFVEHRGMTFLAMSGEVDIGKRFQQVKDFDSKATDIMLCSAMKTGSHWTQEIISMLLSQKAEYNRKESIGQINMECWMEFDKVDEISEPRLFHTHLPFSYLPKKHVENGYKIIYVNRNPKDRAVSQYHFLSGKVGVPKWTWNEFFENYVLKDTLYGGWFAFTKEFQTAINNKSANILPVTYEELKIDPVTHIGRMAEFLEVPYTKDFIKEVALKCDFDHLKANQIDESRMVHPNHESTMFRKGIIGDWKTHFTVAQNEKFDNLCKKELSAVNNIKFIYEHPQ